MKNSVKSFLTLGLSLAFIVGCGGDGFSGPRGSVSGRITYKDKPIPAGCKVLFVAPEGSYTAVAEIKADGKYELSYKGKNLLPAVKYQVSIFPPTEKAAKFDQKTGDPSDASKVASALSEKPKETGPFPSKYSSASASGMMCTVLSGPNTVDFDLTP